MASGAKSCRAGLAGLPFSDPGTRGGPVCLAISLPPLLRQQAPGPFPWQGRLPLLGLRSISELCPLVRDGAAVLHQHCRRAEAIGTRALAGVSVLFNCQRRHFSQCLPGWPGGVQKATHTTQRAPGGRPCCLLPRLPHTTAEGQRHCGQVPTGPQASLAECHLTACASACRRPSAGLILSQSPRRVFHFPGSLGLLWMVLMRSHSPSPLHPWTVVPRLTEGLEHHRGLADKAGRPQVAGHEFP